MSGILLRRGGAVALTWQAALIRRAELPPLQEACALLAEAGRLRDVAAAETAAERERGYRAGYAAGLAAGGAAAAEQAAQQLLESEQRYAAACAAARGAATALALQIVERIAPALGPASLLAALAARAAAELQADGELTLRVHPLHAEAVRAQLPSGGRLHSVQPDPALAEDDCVLVGRHGRVHAGLREQLAQLQRLLAATAEP